MYILYNYLLSLDYYYYETGLTSLIYTQPTLKMFDSKPSYSGNIYLSHSIWILSFLNIFLFNSINSSTMIIISKLSKSAKGILESEYP